MNIHFLMKALKQQKNKKTPTNWKNSKTKKTKPHNPLFNVFYIVQLFSASFGICCNDSQIRSSQIALAICWKQNSWKRIPAEIRSRMRRSKLAREANYKDVGAADLFDQCAEGGYKSELLRALIAKNHPCAIRYYSSADFWVDLGVFWKAVSRMGGLCPPLLGMWFYWRDLSLGLPCDRNLTCSTEAFGICCVLVFPWSVWPLPCPRCPTAPLRHSQNHRPLSLTPRAMLVRQMCCTGGPLDTAPPGVIEDKPILQILKQPGRTDIFLTQTNWLLLSFSGICHKANTQKQEN